MYWSFCFVIISIGGILSANNWASDDEWNMVKIWEGLDLFDHP